MLLRKIKFGCIAAVSLLGLSFGAAPASAGGCGYYGCEAAEVVWVRPYVYASGCGCGAGYYYAYAPAYLYRPAYYVDARYHWRRHHRHRHHAHW
jgi:hypothetical protein